MILKTSFCVDLRTAAQVIAFLNLVSFYIRRKGFFELKSLYIGSSRIVNIRWEHSFRGQRTD